MNRLLRWSLFGRNSDPRIPIVNVVKMEGVSSMTKQQAS